jgi:hypothetical protein
VFVENTVLNGRKILVPVVAALLVVAGEVVVGAADVVPTVRIER